MLPIWDINMALLKGDFRLLRDLVQNGADINIRDKEDRTPLINCCLHDGEEWAFGSARLLLQHGAKLTMQDKCGRNALIYAIMYKREKLVKLYLDACEFDLNHKDRWKRTAIWYAVSCGNTHILSLLRDRLKKYGMQNGHHTGLCRERVSGTGYLLPYKALPASIWEIRAKHYNTGTACLPVLKNTLKQGNTKQRSSQKPNWRQDLKSLYGILEIQLSSSYCPPAKPLPPIPKSPETSSSDMVKSDEDMTRVMTASPLPPITRSPDTSSSDMVKREEDMT